MPSGQKEHISWAILLICLLHAEVFIFCAQVGDASISGRFLVRESDNLRGAVSLRLPSAPIAVSSLVVSPHSSVTSRISSSSSHSSSSSSGSKGGSSSSSSSSKSSSSETRRPSRRALGLRRSGASSALYLCYAEHPIWHQPPRPTQSLGDTHHLLSSAACKTSRETTNQLRQSRALFLTALSSSPPSDSEGAAAAANIIVAVSVPLVSSIGVALSAA